LLVNRTVASRQQIGDILSETVFVDQELKLTREIVFVFIMSEKTVRPNKDQLARETKEAAARDTIDSTSRLRLSN
jgi:hypothetical protein